MGTTSRSSSLRNGGRPLRLAYPIHGKNTFKPSGDPAFLAEEAAREVLERINRVGPQTRGEQKEWDAMLARVAPEMLRRSVEAGAYWDKIRFQVHKSPRARKRALEREARKLQKQTPKL